MKGISEDRIGEVGDRASARVYGTSFIVGLWHG